MNPQTDSVFIEDALECSGRRAGQIINPITGEVVENCLTLKKAAAALGTTTQKLTGLMERLALTDRVLAWKNIPMLSNPVLRRPQYYETSAATRTAIAAGILIPLRLPRRGVIAEMILMTPKGLVVLEEELRKVNNADATVPARATVRRRTVHRLMQQGRSQAEIVRQTAIPKQTVSRIAAEFRSAA